MTEDHGSASIGEIGSSSTASILQPGQGTNRELIIENQRVIQSSLVTGRAEDAQNHMQGNENRFTSSDVPDLNIVLGSNTNNQFESRMVIERREAISKFLADGLKQLIVGQSNARIPRIMGSLNISSSLIHIDLGALGITSLKIAVNIPDLNNASLADAPGATQLMMSNSDDIQIHSKLPAVTERSHVKTPQITKVYYRRSFKSKERSFAKQYAEVANKNTTTSVVGNAQNVSDIEPQYDSLGKSKEIQTTTKRRKCSTPTTTMKLRRSPRFIKKLDGHKPVIVPLKKAPLRSSNKSKKVKPQPDLLGNILLSPTCQASEFPGLSTIAKFADMGTVFPQIPIAEIRKLAIDSCCIPPSEVSAELLLAPRSEKDAEAALAPEEALVSQ
jgi:hypothetical protein